MHGWQDIAAEFWAGRGRERKQRLITVDGFQVLRENNYTLNEVRRRPLDEPVMFRILGAVALAALCARIMFGFAKGRRAVPCADRMNRD